MFEFYPEELKQSKPEQNCGSCRYATKCYAQRAAPRNVVINILACRVKKGIKTNESAKLLLDMIRPNLVRLVNHARNRVGAGYIDMNSMIMDLESKIIESLLDENGYRIGESAYLTEYLFGTNPKTGWVRKWILWDFSKQKRFFSRHTLSGTNPKSDTEEDISEQDRHAIAESESQNTFEEEHIDQNTIDKLMEIIDDGMTLNANEHRVIAFCLSHANESNKTRLIDGTHTYLSNIMGVSRPRITRLYAVARKKLLVAAQERGIGMH